MKTIPLTRGKYALVDDDDYERIMRHNWVWIPSNNSRSGKGYAARKGRIKRGEPHTVHMHREILGAPTGKSVDHINRNSLDNRKANLRFADPQKNSFNRSKPIMKCTSRYKGVFRRTNDCKWTSRIKFYQRTIELGTYWEEEKAASVYNFASRIFFGRYRCENPHVEELTLEEQWRIFRIAQRYIEKYGWYVDTETYRSFFMASAS